VDEPAIGLSEPRTTSLPHGKEQTESTSPSARDPYKQTATETNPASAWSSMSEKVKHMPANVHTDADKQEFMATGGRT